MTANLPFFSGTRPVEGGKKYFRNTGDGLKNYIPENPSVLSHSVL